MQWVHDHFDLANTYIGISCVFAMGKTCRRRLCCHPRHPRHQQKISITVATREQQQSSNRIAKHPSCTNRTPGGKPAMRSAQGLTVPQLGPVLRLAAVCVLRNCISSPNTSANCRVPQLEQAIVLAAIDSTYIIRLLAEYLAE